MASEARRHLDEYRVLILPATRRDGEVTRALLERAELSCFECDDARALAAEVDIAVGAMLLTDAAFHDPDTQELLAVLSRQPPWSDVPAVLLCRTGHQSTIAEKFLKSLRDVTVLERPTSSRTLLSSVQAALRARARQYQLRDQFNALRDSEVALKAASEALQDTNRRKDEFLAMLAHELRNPLAPIRNASEILARKFTADPQIQSIVNIVQRQVVHLARLVDDLLDVSRITEGRIELRRAPLTVASILQQVRESVEPLMSTKGHRFHVGGSPDSLYVDGDHARLVQSIANVLTNAAKYTDPGGNIRLDVRKQGNRAAITVADDGIGISPELLPRIFDLFVQGDRSLDRSEGGLGIGLSVVKRLIEMHHGEVRASSAGLGLGSTFEIHLPLIDPPHLADMEPPRPPVRCRRILVVDDNADAANSLASLLAMEGHETEAVYTAHAALDRAASTRPDVVLLDIGLPDMTGYEVAERMRPILDEV
ncbi:MAG: hybrid sensor histidine kinase/response regulator, partial [Pseudomonadota bacterium]|nr:hybrid sensor histidine kinase/response regulator [Pseudomonadota bacterium]